MSAITDLVGGIVSGLGDTAVKIRTAITGVDPAAAAKLQEIALSLEGQGMQAQAEISKIEAANANLFVSGWRPAIGWVCAIAIAYNFLIIPFGSLILKLAKVDFPMPALDMGELWTLVTGMLGLGVMRTTEKLRGAAGNH